MRSKMPKFADDTKSFRVMKTKTDFEAFLQG